jgi:hypothetical protein
VAEELNWRRPTKGLDLWRFAKFSGYLKRAFALGDSSDAGCIVDNLGD